MNPISDNKYITEQPVTEISAKPKILVVDDSRLVRVSLSRMLSSEFEILEAGDGEAGWEVLLEDPEIRVVLSDAGMPKLDGFELIERIRGWQNERIQEIPVIMITGAEKEQTEIRERALNCGASDFIIKPFDKTQLIARLRSYVKQDSLQKELEETSQTLADHSTIDTLTKLNNKRYFIKRSGQEIALANRHSRQLSFIVLAIDDVEHIRHTYDAETYDQVVLWIVEILSPLLRTEDSFTRISESQFAIIAPTTSRMAAALLAERLRSTVSNSPYTKTVISLPITTTISLLNLARDKPEDANDCLRLLQARIDYGQQTGGNKLIANQPPEDHIPTGTLPAPLKIDTTYAAIPAKPVDTSNMDELKSFAATIIPLIEHFNSELAWEIDDHINAIKKKLAEK